MTTITYDDYLAHYGVKGMKWGVRKKSDRTGSTYKERYKKLRSSYDEELTVKSKNGKTLTIKTDKPLAFADAIFAAAGKDTRNSKSFTIYSDGKPVGDAAFSHKDNGELNLVWLGINKSSRGNGYGQAAFDSAIAYGKKSAAKTLTLEVPGNAPDARHIYEKRGFKVVKEPTAKEIKSDPMWGGLTHMALDISKDEIRHSDFDQELEDAIIQTFSWFDPYSDVSHTSITYDDYLAHYGVKGMKWGKRKARNSTPVEKTHLTDEQKAKRKNTVKKVAIGVGVAAVAAAGAYATYKYGPDVKNFAVNKVKDHHYAKQGKNVLSFEDAQKKFQEALVKDIDSSVGKYNSFQTQAKQAVSLDNSRVKNKAKNAFKDFGTQVTKFKDIESTKRERINKQNLNEQKNLYMDYIHDRSDTKRAKSISNKQAIKTQKKQDFKNNVQLTKNAIKAGGKAVSLIKQDHKKNVPLKEAMKYRAADLGVIVAQDIITQKIKNTFGRD